MASIRKSQRSHRPVERFGSEASSDSITIQKVSNRKVKADTNLYDINIKEIHSAFKRIKVHFIGYEEKFDEWKAIAEDEEFPIAKYERLPVQRESTLAERCKKFCASLCLHIKRQLGSGRRNDPEGRIEMIIDPDVYENFFSTIGTPDDGTRLSKRKCFQNEELDSLLGRRWNVRVKNHFGDFGYVVDGTVCFWIHRRPPLDDFIPVGDRFLPYKYEQELLFVFSFVRGTGNAAKYKELFLQ